MTYEEKRNALVAKAQKLIDEGKITDANDVMQEIKDLDAQHEEGATAAANLAALSNTRQAVTPVAPLMTGQGVLLTDDGNALNSADENDDMFATMEYRNAFKNYIVSGTPIPDKFKNTAEITTSTTAGTTVPTTMYEKIITKLESYGEIYARIFKAAYPTALLIPTLNIKPTASWVDEDKGSDSQKFTTDKVTFAGYKLECKTAFSLFMSKTSLEIFESQFIDLIAEAMVKAIEKSSLTGSGTGCPKGILTETPPTGQAITVAKTAKLTYKLICEAEAAAPAKYNAIWLMTKKTFWSFMGITDDNGQPIARVNAGLNNKPEYVLFGRHVCLTDGYMSDYADTVTKDTLFAAMFDLSYYIFNEVMGIMAKRYVDDNNDNTILKAVMLADGKAVDINSLVTLTKLAAAS